MIKFFRNLRQRLMAEKRFSRYLLYATGEIVLVVVGILIALQINTWNENQQNRRSESAYLKELLEDFELNLQNSKSVAHRIEEVVPRLIGLLEQSALETPTRTLDSLNQDFVLLQTMPAYSSSNRTYDNLIGSGDFRLITSPEIKTALANYYKALEILKLVQGSHEMELVNSFQPYIIEYMDFQAVEMIRVPDFPLPPPMEADRIMHVLKDRKFRNIVTLKITIMTDLLEQNRIMEGLNLELVRLLKKATDG